ncbi:binding protein [Tribonema minus]|uniref:Binding protein n=1 Tax=Tribonema minus TaxID=303371 RepID=A0A835ZJI4_9STRA|nr:binding protein [Tribonema minus]
MATRAAPQQFDPETYTGSNPKVYIVRGMERFRKAKVQESISDFDRALQLSPALGPYLWQRGLSLYYADRFAEGAAQFRLDVSVNPNDTEEAIWAFACEARTLGFQEARKRLLKVGQDTRPYMRTAYSLFQGSTSEQDLAMVGQTDDRSHFYANLYLGLYAECREEVDLARHYIGLAVGSKYCATGDYMCSLARVHQKVRGW